MVLRIRQGLEADRESFTPASGELIYTTDQKKVWVGDGATAGGTLVTGGGGGGASNLNQLTDVTITSPAIGEVLKYDGVKFVNDTDNTGGAPLTTEEVQDIVAGMFDGGTLTNITITYNDGDGTFDVTSAAPGGGGNGTVGVGVAGRLAYYALTGDTVTDVGSGVNWDNDTNTLTLNNLVFNGSTISTEDSGSIELANIVNMRSDIYVDGDIFVADGYHLNANGIHNINGNITIMPQGAEGIVTIGGILNGENLGSKLIVTAYEEQVGGSPIYGGDSIATFISHFGQPGDPSVAPPGVTMARSRGSVTNQLPVQQYDGVGQILFSGFDGTSYPISAGIGHIITGSVSTGVLPGGMALYCADNSGTPKTGIFLDGSIQQTELQFNVRMSESDPITFLPVASKTLSFTTARVKFTPLTGAERDALTGVTVGEVIFNTTTTRLQVCTSLGPTVWADLN